MDLRCRDERVYARPLGVLYRFPSGVNVRFGGSCKRADDGPLYLLRYLPNRIEFPGGSDRKTCLDDVNIKARKLPRDKELLIHREARSRALLAVAQCRVEYEDLLHFSCLLVFCHVI